MLTLTEPTRSETAFREAARAHSSLLAAPEKKFLIWIAQRLPAWVNSDHLTALGFLGMFLVGASFACTRWNRAGMLLAILSLGINWFGDSLDGTLARVRQCQRPKYGFYLDHVVDCFGATLVLAGLALSGVMSPAVAACVLVAYLLLSIEIYLATYTLGTFHMSFGKFGPTELRILLAIGSLRVSFNPNTHLFGREFLLFDVGGTISAAALLTITIHSVIRHARALARNEPQRVIGSEEPGGR